MRCGLFILFKVIWILFLISVVVVVLYVCYKTNSKYIKLWVRTIESIFLIKILD